MSVDKFGRHPQRNSELLRGPPGPGFTLTSDGDFDVKNRRLVNIGAPIEDHDAVALQYFQNNKRDCNNKNLRNLATPKVETDAANKRYVDKELDNAKKEIKQFTEENCLSLNADKTVLDCKMKRITNVRHATHWADAVNARWVMENCLHFVNNKPIDAHEHRIENVKDPSKDTDVVTKKYLDEKIDRKFEQDIKTKLSTYLKDISITVENDVYSAGNRRIVNLNDPVEANDGCNKNYVDSEMKKRQHELEESIETAVKKLKPDLEIIKKVLDKFDNEIQLLYFNSIRPDYPPMFVEKKARDMFTAE